MSNWADYADRLTLQARKASRQLAIVTGEQKQRWLHRSAELLMQHVEQIVEANKRDLQAAPVDYAWIASFIKQGFQHANPLAPALRGEG